MRAATPTFAAILPYTHRVVASVDAYYAGALTLAGVPVIEGTITRDESAVVKAAVSLSVPVETALSRLDPGSDPLAPLQCYGQRIRVKAGIELPGKPGARVFEMLDQGWFLIVDWKRDDAEKVLTVNASSLAQLLVDAQLYHPLTPAAGATFKSEFTRLVGGLLPVVFDPALVDRPLDSTMTVWERDRAGHLVELADAWPARWYINDAGAVYVTVPYTPVTPATTPAVTLTDGIAGTVTARQRGNERARLYNAVVVDGKLGDDGAAGPHRVAEVTDPASPIRVSGPFGPRPRFHTSDLITTNAQADAVAAALLNRYTSFGRAEALGLIPDPRLELGDIGRVYTADGDAHTGRLTQLSLPLAARQGGMGAVVSTLPAADSTRKPVA